FAATTYAQYATNKRTISYQAVVRDANGQLAANKAIGVQISILCCTPGNPPMFTERHSVTTNENGLLSIEIGAGEYLSGISFLNIYFGQLLYVKTELDLLGGSNYTQSSTSSILSVPSANYAMVSSVLEGPAWNFVGAYTMTNDNNSDFEFLGYVYIQYLSPTQVLFLFRPEDKNVSLFDGNTWYDEEFQMPLGTLLGEVFANKIEFKPQGSGWYEIDEEDRLSGELIGDDLKIWFTDYPSEYFVLRKKR
ncbi:MAG: hypothetical protein ACPF8V_09865, partial [Luteibaculum sp.]